MEAHHLLPQQFRKFFDSVGLNVDNPLFGKMLEKIRIT